MITSWKCEVFIHFPSGNVAECSIIFFLLPPPLQQGRIWGTLKWAPTDKPPDHPSIVILCTWYHKNLWTFSFHSADIYSSWHCLNLIRTRRWLAEYRCHGNHLGNLACVRDILKTVQDLAFTLRRSIPHTAQKAGDLEHKLISTADKHNNRAFYEKSMNFLTYLVNTIRFIFRCGGKSDLTSEDRERSNPRWPPVHRV